MSARKITSGCLGSADAASGYAPLPHETASGGDGGTNVSSSSRKREISHAATSLVLTLRKDAQLHVADNATLTSSSTTASSSTTSSEARHPSGRPAKTGTGTTAESSNVTAKDTNGSDDDLYYEHSSSSPTNCRRRRSRGSSSPFYQHVREERHYLAFAEEILAELDDVDSSDDEA